MNILSEINKVKNLLLQFENNTSTAWPDTDRAIKMLEKIALHLIDKQKIEWHLCDNVMPEVGKDVIVFQEGSLAIAHCSNSGSFYGTIYDVEYFDVTAWAEIPEELQLNEDGSIKMYRSPLW